MQPWGSLDYGQRHVVLGVSGSGKSTLIKRMTADAWRCLWFDVEGEYHAPGRLVVTVDELERFPALLRDPHVRLVVEPQGERAAELAEEVERLSLLFLGFRWLPMVVVFEELGDYGRHPSAEKALNRIYKKGRKRGVVPVVCGQVTTDVPLHSRKNATDAWVLLQSHPDELEELADTYGPEMARRAAGWREWDDPAHWNVKKGLVT